MDSAPHTPGGILLLAAGLRRLQSSRVTIILPFALWLSWSTNASRIWLKGCFAPIRERR